jgi:hypothetical protein
VKVEAPIYIPSPHQASSFHSFAPQLTNSPLLQSNTQSRPLGNRERTPLMLLPRNAIDLHRFARFCCLFQNFSLQEHEMTRCGAGLRIAVPPAASNASVTSESADLGGADEPIISRLLKESQSSVTSEARLARGFISRGPDLRTERGVNKRRSILSTSSHRK